MVISLVLDLNTFYSHFGNYYKGGTMTLNLQKAELNGQKYFVVPLDLYPFLTLTSEEEKGVLKMEFGQSFFLVPIPNSKKSVSDAEIEDFVDKILKDKKEKETKKKKEKKTHIEREYLADQGGGCGSSGTAGGCGVTADDIWGCGHTEDPCGHSISSSSGCGYTPDPCGHTYYRGSSC